MSDISDLQAEVEAVRTIGRRPGPCLVTPEEAVAALAEPLRAGKRAPDEAIDQWESADFEISGLQERITALEAENEALKEAILDIDAHATPYGDIPYEPGWVGTYLVTAGALHRALGKIGHTAPSCKAEAENAKLREALRIVWIACPKGARDAVTYDYPEIAALASSTEREASDGV